MATEDADAPDSGGLGDVTEAEATSAGTDTEGTGEAGARAGEYTWADFMREHGHGEEVDALYPGGEGGGLLGRSSGTPGGDDWDRVEFDPEAYLGFHPDELEARLREAAGPRAKAVQTLFQRRTDPENVPVVKDIYTWEHFKHEYYYEDGEPPRTRGGQVEPFEAHEYLGFDPDDTEGVLSYYGGIGESLGAVVDERTVTTIDRFDEEDLETFPDIEPEDVEAFDEDEFFTTEDGHTTLVNRYDLEKAVPLAKKVHFREEHRYWVNKPYAFVIVFHSIKENEKKYYVVEPHLNEIERDLMEFLTGKLRNAIKYSDDEVVVEGSEEDRRQVIERETRKLLRRYDLYSGDEGEGLVGRMKALLGVDGADAADADGDLEGIEARPEPTVLEEDPERVAEYQVEKLLYYLKRNFIGYERIDPIKHDINVEDISCDGYNSPVFVYHSDYEQVITNIYHGEDQLDDFVVKLAQRSGKGISKRRPQVDATLPDGSRAQLTLGREVSDHGTNYTIRQFQDVPHTPVDLINWNTFSLEEMAFLWLCIENNKSLIFAGGTASGKTTSLNAVSLFIPSNAKIVSIEDTREVELPQRNWIASVTRPAFGEDEKGDVDEFDLLEAALRQRPDYIVMGEVRGEEGRTLFQVMSTGHTTYTTFHADSVGEVIKRFTTDPINVSKTMFTALDLVSIQTQTRVQGTKVRRNKNLTEINHYDAENDEINVQDVYQWQAETDEFLKMGESNTLEEIMFDRGWSREKLQDELFKREVILAYLIENDLNTYTEVAATIQAFINDPDTILTLVANGQLAGTLDDLREMESVLIDVDEDKEALVPRPDPDEEIEQLCLRILDRAEDSLLDEYRGKTPSGLAGAIPEPAEELPPEPSEIVQVPDEQEEIEFTGEVSEEALEAGQFDLDYGEEGDEEAFAFGEDAGAEPSAPALEGSDADADADAEATAGAGEDEAEDGGEGEGEGGADTGGPEWLFGEDEGDEEAFTFDEEDDAGGGLAFDEGDGGDGGDGGEESDGETGGLAFDEGEEGGGAEEGDGGFAFGDGGEVTDAGSDGGAEEGEEGEDFGDFGGIDLDEDEEDEEDDGDGEADR